MGPSLAICNSIWPWNWERQAGNVDLSLEHDAAGTVGVRHEAFAYLESRGKGRVRG